MKKQQQHENSLDDFLQHSKDKKNALKKIIKELDKKKGTTNSKTK